MIPQFQTLARRHVVLAAQPPLSGTLTIARMGRHQAAAGHRPQANAASTEVRTTSTRDAIERFYAAQNAGDTDQIAALMADDVEYHDMVYAEAFQGREAVRDYFEKVKEAVPEYVKFVAEDIVSDERAAGVRWHVEIDGNEFPFSRGVSFYEFDGDGKMVKARDVVEGAVKPGTSTLRAIGVLAPLMRKLGPRASPAYLPTVTWWSFYAGYVGTVLLSDSVPGVPAFQVSWSELQATIHESANLFYVNIFMDRLGIAPVPSIPEHPVDEALFNFALAWSLMLAPLMLLDPRARHIRERTRWLLWTGTMFLTNIFFIPFMALRAAPAAPESRSTRWPARLPLYSRAFGAVAAAVGAFSIYWVLFGRPEYGDFAERWQHTVATYYSSRIFFAFVLDLVLYSVFQTLLMPEKAGYWRYVPFVGLAVFLVSGEGDDDSVRGRSL